MNPVRLAICQWKPRWQMLTDNQWLPLIIRWLGHLLWKGSQPGESVREKPWKGWPMTVLSQDYLVGTRLTFLTVRGNGTLRNSVYRKKIKSCTLPAWVCGYESCIAASHFDFPEEANHSENGTGPGSRDEDSGAISSTVLLGGRHFTTLVSSSVKQEFWIK